MKKIAFILMFLDSIVFLGCSAGLKVLKPVETQVHVSSVFVDQNVSMCPNAQNINLAERSLLTTTAGEFIDTLISFLKQEGFAIAETPQSADLSLSICMTDFVFYYWVVTDYRKSSKGEVISSSPSDVRSVTFTITYTDGAGRELGIVQRKTIANLSGRIEKSAEDIAGHTRKNFGTK